MRHHVRSLRARSESENLDATVMDLRQNIEENDEGTAVGRRREKTRQSPIQSYLDGRRVEDDSQAWYVSNSSGTTQKYEDR